MVTSNRPPLVGLYSSVMQSGKSTVAGILEDGHDFERVRFAGALKGMVKSLAMDAGYTLADATRMTDGDLKEAPIPEFAGKPPRWLMQSLGTEWGRGLISADLWVDVAMAKADRIRSEGWPVVIDDVRFPNEAQAIKDAGGIMVKIDRGLPPPAVRHPSEGSLDDWPFDYTVENRGDLDDLRSAVSVLELNL